MNADYSWFSQTSSHVHVNDGDYRLQRLASDENSRKFLKSPQVLTSSLSNLQQEASKLMRIYTPRVSEGQEWALFKIDKDYRILTELGGRRQPNWGAPQMELLTKKEDGKPRLYSDFPWFGEHVLVLRNNALKLMSSILAPYGEFLPLSSRVPLSLFNVTNVVDALDEKRSKIVRYDDGGIMVIETHVFHREAIDNNEIFKLPERSDGVHVSDIYLQDTIVHRIGELGLKGIAFELIWSDEIVDESWVEYPGLETDELTSGIASVKKYIASLLRRIGVAN